jgi:hypothetical protein
MRRPVLGGLIVGAAVLGLIGPAAAHEEINPSTFPTAKPVFLTLAAADETKADLVKVTLAAPNGTPFGPTTKEPAGWAVNRTDQLITWTGGNVKPDRFEQWGFEIEGADQPGTLTYKVTLGYADGKSDDVTVDVTAAATGAGQSRASTKGGGSSSRADAALAVGVAAVILALVGVALGLRRPPRADASPAGAASDGGQDW